MSKQLLLSSHRHRTSLETYMASSEYCLGGWLFALGFNYLGHAQHSMYFHTYSTSGFVKKNSSYFMYCDLDPGLPALNKCPISELCFGFDDLMKNGNFFRKSIYTCNYVHLWNFLADCLHQPLDGIVLLKCCWCWFGSSIIVEWKVFGNEKTCYFCLFQDSAVKCRHVQKLATGMGSPYKLCITKWRY